MQGAPSLLDSEETLAVITDLSAQQEQELLPKKPWTLDKMTADALRMQRRAIVGIAVSVLDIEAKSKMSQNRSEADQSGVITGLRGQGVSDQAAVAETMAASLADD